jgi:phosphoglycolate phosphatase-like HAD superfamily hydrolase
MNTAYEVRKLEGGDVFVSSRSLELLAKVDAVVFDCDGTLVDVRASYDTDVFRTVVSLTAGFFAKTLFVEDNWRGIFEKIKRTGGFNSDWDVTYAISLFIAAAYDGKVPRGSKAKADDEQARLSAIVDDFAAKPRLKGWRSVDEYLKSQDLESSSVGELRGYMGFPGNPPASRLASIFDQLYYGEDLYRRIYGAAPTVECKKGLIDNEKMIITEESLARLTRFVGGKRIAMATGRAFIAVEYAMRDLLGYFERDASVFIGDSEIVPELGASLDKYRKPSGQSLLLAREKLSSKVLLYVGDSAEDRLMVDNAGAPKGSILFAGIYGTSSGDRDQIGYFTDSGSDIVVKEVNQIPEILEMARR